MAEILRLILLRDLDRPLAAAILHHLPRSPSSATSLPHSPAGSTHALNESNTTREVDLGSPTAEDVLGLGFCLVDPVTDDSTSATVRPPPPLPPLPPDGDSVTTATTTRRPSVARARRRSDATSVHSGSGESVLSGGARDPRIAALLEVQGDDELQRKYADLFYHHLLLNKNDDHDDMLFYVPMDWPDHECRDRAPPTDPPAKPCDMLIIQRNVATTASLPPSLPARVDWLLSVWLNLIMQHAYSADVSVDLSASARILRSYPVYANPYHIDPDRDTVTCSFPYLYFSLGENHGTLTADSKMFLTVSTTVKPRFGGGPPSLRSIAEITLSHSSCLDHLRRNPSPASSSGGSGSSLLYFFIPAARRWGARRPREYVVECSRGVSQIALLRSSSSASASSTIEYTIQTVRIHILDVIAQLLL
ncbi:hypothetical protein H9P43_004599 [Blastocladiella emersonii ATCC 22665]|nr:hypothetical protein H9P43_004599 [Blastocladiella emersonii ATCC 22665]